MTSALVSWSWQGFTIEAKIKLNCFNESSSMILFYFFIASIITRLTCASCASDCDTPRDWAFQLSGRGLQAPNTLVVPSTHLHRARHNLLADSTQASTNTPKPIRGGWTKSVCWWGGFLFPTSMRNLRCPNYQALDRLRLFKARTLWTRPISRHNTPTKIPSPRKLSDVMPHQVRS